MPFGPARIHPQQHGCEIGYIDATGFERMVASASRSSYSPDSSVHVLRGSRPPSATMQAGLPTRQGWTDPALPARAPPKHRDRQTGHAAPHHLSDLSLQGRQAGGHSLGIVRVVHRAGAAACCSNLAISAACYQDRRRPRSNSKATIKSSATEKSGPATMIHFTWVRLWISPQAV